MDVAEDDGQRGNAAEHVQPRQPVCDPGRVI
jgi:hypothetical protein